MSLFVGLDVSVRETSVGTDNLTPIGRKTASIFRDFRRLGSHPPTLGGLRPGRSAGLAGI